MIKVTIDNLDDAKVLLAAVAAIDDALKTAQTHLDCIDSDDYDAGNDYDRTNDLIASLTAASAALRGTRASATNSL